MQEWILAIPYGTYFLKHHVNESFDEATVQDNGWQYLPDGWEGYPNQNSQTVVFEGEPLYNSEDPFCTI
ncbi:hypothetical protein Ct9H90mP29_19620 [bacterium]|nr:MAG: hypothetical protein Ct9H90mP29_19620 [bacterium]